jgi:hypothetical protein
MVEVKSGANDTPGGARGQLETGQKSLADLADGDPIRLQLEDGTDVTSRFDLDSAKDATLTTTGPVSGKGGWTESLGVTQKDLLFFSLVLDPSKIGDYNIFRLKKRLSAIIVSEEVKRRFEDAAATGAVFKSVKGDCETVACLLENIRDFLTATIAIQARC